MIAQVARRYKFRASHAVEGLSAPWCERHEHDYTVEIVAEGSGSLVVDTDLIDGAWRFVSPAWEGQYLNDTVGGRTTVEDLAARLLEGIADQVEEVVAITVWEDDDRWGRASR